MNLRASNLLSVLFLFFLSLSTAWAGNGEPTPLWRSRGAIIPYCAALVAGTAIPVIPALLSRPGPAAQRSIGSVDLDHDRVISDIEMNGIATPALVKLLDRIKPTELPKMMGALTNSKLAWVFLEAPSVEWKNKWLLPIAQTDPKRVARMMLAVREPQSAARQNLELLLLEGLPPEVEASVLAQWKLLDDNATLPGPEDSRTVGESSDDRSTLEIPQNGYIFTNVGKHPRVQTFGVGPCVTVTLWDAKTKSAVLAHMHPKTAAEVALDFDRMLGEFAVRGIPVNGLEVGIVGGWEQFSKDLVFFIRNRLLAADIPPAQFKYVNTLGRNEGNLDVELDLSNGEVSIYTEKVSGRNAEQTIKGLGDAFNSFGKPVVRHPASR
jgi:hypothetical protein